jgi:hypothetical protein
VTTRARRRGILAVMRAWLGLGLVVLVALVALTAARPGQPVPDLTGGPWINSPPLTMPGLHGRVVFVEFWTYG